MSISLKHVLAGLVLAGFPFAATAQNKVGTINIQQAIVSTKDGQKAVTDLQAKFDPRRKDLEGKRSQIEALQQQLQKMGTVGSEDAKRKLQLDIEAKQKGLQRDSEDAQADFEQDQSKLLNDLGGRIMQVINKYATDNGFSMILDISSPQTPVIWASTAVDVTNDVVKLYDANAPSSMAPAKPAAPAAKTPAPPAKK
ncbi:MAG: OmpH family outer membrane protein [Bryobacter sp.]|nr:OmpH family outer membrane protein [Bryobacter sp.]